MEEGTSQATSADKNADDGAETKSGSEEAPLDSNGQDSTEKRFDEDALPVPLEDVELLTGGVDENDDRTVEFPWDEEARRARVDPRPIKFDGGLDGF